MFRKEYRLSQMSFGEFRKMGEKYLSSKLGDKIFPLTVDGDTIWGCVVRLLDGFVFEFYTDEYINGRVNPFLVIRYTDDSSNVTVTYATDVIDTSNADGWKFKHEVLSTNDLMGYGSVEALSIDVTGVISYQHALESMLSEMVQDKVDRHNTNVKCGMAFVIMISILGYCITKVVEYIKADKADRKTMVKSIIAPIGILAVFSATTNTFRFLIEVIIKSYKLTRDCIRKFISICNKFKKGC